MSYRTGTCSAFLSLERPRQRYSNDDAAAIGAILRDGTTAMRFGDEAHDVQAKPKVRLVAALADSIFQGELLMAETRFVRLFPEQEGYRFLLADVPLDRAVDTAKAIERGAGDLGADAASTSERLAAFHTVENTYLSTFQTLGGLGLVLGTLGLATVLLRNVLERRRELALLRAIGYNSGHFALMVITENAFLVSCGLVTGSLTALVAIGPAFVSRGGNFPALSMWLLLSVFVTGLFASLAATVAALRTPLLPALRSE